MTSQSASIYVPHWLDDKRVYSCGCGSCGEKIPKFNPATGELLSLISAGCSNEVLKAISLAEASLSNWSGRSLDYRAEMLKKTLVAMESNRKVIAKILSSESGRSDKMVNAEIDAAISYGEFFVGESRRFYGTTMASKELGRFAYFIRQPVGICLLITPFNGPLVSMAKKVFPALLCGNTIVLKSHELTPMTGILLAQCLQEAGLPSGVFSVVQGIGSKIGPQLVGDPRVAMISFTGSSQTGRIIKSQSHTFRMCFEMGGKNAFVVCDDADLDRAVEYATLSAFANAGQMCASASRIIVFDSIYDEFRDKLIQRAKSLGVGTSHDDFVPPIITEDNLHRILEAFDGAISRGGVILTGGQRVNLAGYFLEPTVFENVSPDDPFAQEELFGPATCLFRADNLDEAIAITNNSKFGLTAAIHTDNLHRAEVFKLRCETGVVRINGHTYGSEPQDIPFGGRKLSGNGWREPGTDALDVYTEKKFVSFDHDQTRV
ncbi:MAG: aldehyde dehydrogenase family protein [bacterium]|nr:aldehyde dehydrogenase family protein [bacterium]